MKDIVKNQIKTILGLIVGIPLVGILRPLNDFLFSVVQCIFFAFFYTLIDKSEHFIRSIVIKHKGEKKHE